MNGEQRTAEWTPLKRAIKDRGLSQRWVASELGISESQMSQFARGLRPSKVQRREIANFLSAPQSELWPDA